MPGCPLSLSSMPSPSTQCTGPMRNLARKSPRTRNPIESKGPDQPYPNPPIYLSSQTLVLALSHPPIPIARRHSSLHRDPPRSVRTNPQPHAWRGEPEHSIHSRRTRPVPEAAALVLADSPSPARLKPLTSSALARARKQQQLCPELLAPCVLALPPDDRRHGRRPRGQQQPRHGSPDNAVGPRRRRGRDGRSRIQPWRPSLTPNLWSPVAALQSPNADALLFPRMSIFLQLWNSGFSLDSFWHIDVISYRCYYRPQTA
ncbi:CASP-like protein 4U1 [Hordeum vulgare subsp. vulgare]|uniref:CASP-like protein 4U1 n=1 Tax=Hordeum vulgare subsp. vulgare TaxID=112509 RepID=UPI001D1A4E41|nr:CASP-like protein 4U1 [Hordeum vulgare subsp. vulgare]